MTLYLNICGNLGNVLLKAMTQPSLQTLYSGPAGGINKRPYTESDTPLRVLTLPDHLSGLMG